MKIGIAGIPGSFSELAGQAFVEEARLQNAEIVDLAFAEQVLSALEAGTIDYAVFAIENSNGGVVLEYLEPIGKHRFHVEKTFEIVVEHALLAKKGKNASDIKKITSQKQALAQCRMYLKRKWHGVEIQEYIDTASAAKDLAEGKLTDDTAVVAHKRCADLYGLEILEESIQDLKFNFTTFIVASQIK